MTTHSPIGPSGAARRKQCPRSVTLEALYPETGDNPDAADGEASHWVLAQLLDHQQRNHAPQPGTVAPNGVVLTHEMVHGAALCADHVKATLGWDWHLRAFVERTFPIPSVHPQAFGTPDVQAWLDGGQRPVQLHVWDYKFGFRYVEEHGNPQCVDYVAAALDQAPGIGEVDIHVHIVQPRAFHRGGSIRTWRTTRAEILPLIEESRASAAEALGPDPRARVGEECRDCKARHACPTLQAEGYRAAQYSSGVQPLDLPPAALGLELRTLQQARARLDARIVGLEGQAEGLMRQGQRVPGFILQQGQGRERFKVPPEQVVQVGKLMGKNLAKPLDVVTPRQARDLGMPEALINSISERPPGAFKVEPFDDMAALKIFGVPY